MQVYSFLEEVEEETEGNGYWAGWEQSSETVWYSHQLQNGLQSASLWSDNLGKEEEEVQIDSQNQIEEYQAEEYSDSQQDWIAHIWFIPNTLECHQRIGSK